MTELSFKQYTRAKLRKLPEITDSFQNEILRLNSEIIALKKQLIHTKSKRIALASKGLITFINCETITHLQADGNYTRLFYNNGKSEIYTYTLKKLMSILNCPCFLRVHHSFVINTHYIQRINKEEGMKIVIKNGPTIPVSRTKKTVVQEFIQLLSN